MCEPLTTKVFSQAGNGDVEFAAAAVADWAVWADLAGLVGTAGTDNSGYGAAARLVGLVLVDPGEPAVLPQVRLAPI